MSGENNISSQWRRVFIEYLDHIGARLTQERQMVLDAALASARSFTARELHMSIEKNNVHVSMATVYNSLALLCDCGIATPIAGDGNERSFSIGCGRTIRVFCRRCGKSRAVHDSKIESILAEHHFRGLATEGFDLTVTGLCPSCVRAMKKAASAGKNIKTKQKNK